MNIVVSIVLTLLVFTLIVVIHEGGHFWMARKMGVFVEEFAIGMGPAIYKRMTKKGMRFSIRALPIGGFCQMKGEEQQEGVVPDEDDSQWRRRSSKTFYGLMRGYCCWISRRSIWRI